MLDGLHRRIWLGLEKKAAKRLCRFRRFPVLLPLNQERLASGSTKFFGMPQIQERNLWRS